MKKKRLLLLTINWLLSFFLSKRTVGTKNKPRDIIIPIRGRMGSTGLAGLGKQAGWQP